MLEVTGRTTWPSHDGALSCPYYDLCEEVSVDPILCPKNTIVLDWQDRYLYFKKDTGELGQVHFRELQSKNDWFRYCCAIAIVQDYYTRDQQCSEWRGVDNSLAGSILSRFGWQLTPTSQQKYWTHHFTYGEDAQFHLTDTWTLNRDGTRNRTPAKEVFNMVDGYILGEPRQESGGLHRFWSVEFVNENDEFLYFREAVMQLFDSGSCVHSSSTLTDEVLMYLRGLAEDCAKLPRYYPPHLYYEGSGRTAFDRLCPAVRVVEDRPSFEQVSAQEREREGLDPSAWAYSLTRGILKAPDGEKVYEVAARTISWDEQASRQFSRATIFGDPGFGKTWLLRLEARRLACESMGELSKNKEALDTVELPFFLHLSDLVCDEETLERAIVKVYCKTYSKGFCEYIHKRLTSGHCVLLLDAWDEVSNLEQKRKLKDLIRTFSAESSARILLTSRPAGYGLTQPPLPDGEELELVAWNRRQIECFVHVWFGSSRQKAKRFLNKLRRDSRFHSLARIPLTLRLLCQRCPDGSFPKRRSSLYRACLWGLLRDWHIHDKEYLARRTKTQLSDTYISGLIEVLERLSLELHEKGTYQFQEDDVRPILESFLRDLHKDRLWHELVQEEANPTKLIEQFTNDGILILDRSTGTRQFLHATFQEYLAARALAKRNDGVERALRHLYDPAWKSVLILLGGTFEKEVGIYIAAMLCKNREDLLCRPFLIAVQAAAEAGQEKLSTAFLDRLTEIMVAQYTQGSIFEGLLAREIIPHLSGSVPYLVRTLETEDRAIRIRAIEALGWIGLPSIMKALLEELQNADRHVRRYAVEALGQIGSENALPVLTEMLKDPNGDVREEAVKALGKIGYDEAIPELLNAVNRGSILHVVVAEALAEIGSGTAENTLLKWLEDARMHVRQAAVPALGRIGSKRAAEALCGALADSATGVSWSAQVALGKMAPKHVVKQLIEAMQDSRCPHRWAAARTLGWIGHSQAMKPLLEALCDCEQSMRQVAATALGDTRSELAIPALVMALEDEDEWVGACAAKALSTIGSKEVTKPLLKALNSPSKVVRAFSAEALGDLSGQVIGESAVEPLTKVLKDPVSQTRKGAVKTLGQIGLSETVPQLREALKDESSGVCKLAAEALGKIASEQAIKALFEALGDLRVRSKALEALCSIESDQVAKKLLKSLKDDDRWISGKLVTRLCTRGYEPALLALVRMLNRDAVSEIHAAAAIARFATKRTRPWMGKIPVNVRREFNALSKSLERLTKSCDFV